MMRCERHKRADRLVQIMEHYLTLAEKIDEAMTQENMWNVDNKATRLLKRQYCKYRRICRKVNSYLIQLYW